MASAASYGKTVTGPLMLGGMEIKRSKKHKKKKHKKEKKRERDDDAEDHDDSEEDVAAPAPAIVIMNGSGRISTSGTTVQGHEGTKFMAELRAGDAVIITHPTTMGDETRIVKMVLSNISIGISSAFSSDLISTTPFRFVKAPVDVIQKAGAASKKPKEEQPDSEGIKSYIDSEGNKLSTEGKFVYRVTRAGKTGYNYVSEDIAGRSRSELMDKRSKSKSDRFCM